MNRVATLLALVCSVGSTASLAHANTPAAPPKTVAAAVQKILAARIPAYYGNGASTNNNFGVVTELGKAKLTRTSNPNIVKAAVRFDGNELWGGDQHYKVNVDVNLKTKLIKPLGRPVATATIN